MPFTDEDLKRLKERVDKGNPKMIVHWQDLEALIARLEAAENIVENPCYCYEDTTDSCKCVELNTAWRKAAGKI